MVKYHKGANITKILSSFLSVISIPINVGA